MHHILAAMLLLLAPVAFAETAEEIMDRAREARKSDSSVQTLKMVLISKTGSERVRQLDMKMRRFEGDVVKTTMRFTSPADVAGTSFLQIDHPDREDEQLLYLPAVKRTTRISGKGRKGAFMGSNFTYEDLEIGDREGSSHQVVSEDDTHWVIETDPGEDSSYGKLVSMVVKADYIANKVEFFDDEGVLVKTLEITETRQDGDRLVAKVSTMTSAKKGTATRLEVLEQRFDVPEEEVSDDMFTASYLERG